MKLSGIECQRLGVVLTEANWMPWSPETVPFIYKDDSGAPSYWFLVQIHLYALTED